MKHRSKKPKESEAEKPSNGTNPVNKLNESWIRQPISYVIVLIATVGLYFYFSSQNAGSLSQISSEVVVTRSSKVEVIKWDKNDPQFAHKVLIKPSELHLNSIRLST